MSQPTFPVIDPEITREHALNMILTSIAMEELALSHIMNAEGEKLQYVLGTLGAGSGKEPDINEVLAVNQSITCLLEGVAQNQILLKNKMDKALHALRCTGSGPTGPTGPQGPTRATGPTGDAGPTGARGQACIYPPRCSAVFKGRESGEIWRAGCALPWNREHIHGCCAQRSPCDCTKIELLSRGRFMVGFVVNLRAECNCECDIAISLQMLTAHKRSDLFAFHGHISHADTIVTASMGEIIVEIPDRCGPTSLLLKLLSPDMLTVEQSMLSIAEI